jgi:hypothetical protein
MPAQSAITRVSESEALADHAKNDTVTTALFWLAKTATRTVTASRIIRYTYFMR